MAEMSMIERVAKALHEHGVASEFGYAWADADADERARAYGYARAAIEAMREPTEAMVDAAGDKIGFEVDWVRGLFGGSYGAGSQVLTDGYESMIDAALSEEVAG